MRRTAVSMFAALTFLLLCWGGIGLIPADPPPAQIEPPAGPQELCFATPQEARQYLLTRLRYAEGADPAEDPYSSTFTRRYTTVAGETVHYFLVADAARELALAEGFRAHGFLREARTHYENLVSFHAETPEARRAEIGLQEIARGTVLGLVPPMSVVVSDKDGRRFVPAAASCEIPRLDRIHLPFLESGAPAPGPLTMVGFIDDTGRIIAENPFPPDLQPAVFFPDSGDVREGAVSSRRSYYVISPVSSLFEAERLAKSGLFKEIFRRLEADEPIEADEARAAGEALLYLGVREKTLQLLQLSGSTEQSPLDTTLATLTAADPRSPLHLDALWKLALNDNPRFTLSTRSSVTSGAELPVQIEAQAIQKMTFTFNRLTGPVPLEEKLLKEWARTGPTEPGKTEILDIPAGKSELRLPLSAAGAYRVTAEARGVSCSFLAVRTDLTVEAFAFPSQISVAASHAGLSISSGGILLGTTDEDGILCPTKPLRGKICEEHRACCAGCESCDHHHGTAAGLSSSAQVLVTGQGQFFRATLKLDRKKLDELKPTAAPQPLLFIHTDRPVYKAGDTIRFRGILRIPRSPLKPRDDARVDPAPAREVAVSIRCRDVALFQRTYVTGDPGTFIGEFMLPLSAYRTEYSLDVAFNGVQVSQPFEVLDYRKSDFSVQLTPEPGGVRVQAGYVWGDAVPGAALRCTVGGKEVVPLNNLIPALDGEKVTVALLRDKEELAAKSLVYRNKTAPAVTPEPKKPEPGAPAPQAALPSDPAVPAPAPAPVPEPFRIRTSKSLHLRGDTIEVHLEGPWAEAEATVLLGDVQLYDRVRVPIRDGRGVARFAARGLHDPGVSVFAFCNGLRARADIEVRANQMKVELDAPVKGRPGEQVEVKVRAEPNAVLALAAVDEAIYMIREDDTPEIYAYFHPRRPAAVAYGRFEDFEFDGETHRVERWSRHPNFRIATRMGNRVVRNYGQYDAIGVGPGGGGGGRYGSRFGGRENLVARGGGSRATESAVLNGLRYLASVQRADGSWPCSYVTEAGTITDQGATSLALLSFLGAGYSHLSKDEFVNPMAPGQLLKFGETVKRALLWLMGQPDARVAAGTGDANLNHAWATLALSEAYGMTAAQLLKDPAQKALDSLATRQSLNGGWNRADSSLNGELLATVIAVMALKSGQLSELAVSPAAPANAHRFLNQSLDENGLCDPATRATTGGAMVALLFLRKEKADPRLAGAAQWLLARPPKWSDGDFLGHYFASLGLFMYDGPDGPCWKRWEQPLRNMMVPNQARDGSLTVSNESIYHTAMGQLMLEVYYRYANVFGSSGNRGGFADAPPLAPAPRVRIYFPDTALWVPEMITDAEGIGRVSFKLPEQITTTRLTARGITKTGAAGQAVARIETKQPFWVKIRAPEFVVLGDEIDIRADVFNYTSAELEARVWLEGREPQTLRVTPDRPSTATWRVKATDAAGLRLVAQARGGAHEDAMEKIVPVRRLGRETLATIRGRSETGQTFRFEAPYGAQELVVKIHPQRGNLSQLLDALRYLNAYPYG